MWKVIFTNYRELILRCTEKDEGSEKAMLQSEKAWAQLKAIDGISHLTRLGLLEGSIKLVTNVLM
jgi:hypothetical protein